MSAPVVALVCLLFLGTLAPSAEAGDDGFYVGGSFAITRKDTESTEFELFAGDLQDFVFLFTPTDERTSFDDSDTSYSLFVGYRFTRHIAVEGGYARLGELSYRSFASGDFPMDRGTLNIAMDSETSGFTVSALGILPINYNWEVYGRAGVLFATNEFALSLGARGEIFAQPSGAQSFSKSTEDMYAGLGVSMRFFDIYDVRLEYQRIFDAGLPLTLNAGDLDVASLGLIVTF